MLAVDGPEQRAGGLRAKLTRRGLIPAAVAALVTVGMHLAGLPAECADAVRAAVLAL